MQGGLGEVLARNWSSNCMTAFLNIFRASRRLGKVPNALWPQMKFVGLVSWFCGFAETIFTCRSVEFGESFKTICRNLVKIVQTVRIVLRECEVLFILVNHGLNIC